MRFRSKFLMIALVASLLNGAILEPEMSFAMGVPCEVLVGRDFDFAKEPDREKTLAEKMAKGLKAIPQTLRVARIPGVGRYKTVMDKAEDIYLDLSQKGPEAVVAWQADFRDRVERGQITKPEESIVDLRFLEPKFGMEMWELMM